MLGLEHRDHGNVTHHDVWETCSAIWKDGYLDSLFWSPKSRMSSALNRNGHVSLKQRQKLQLRQNKEQNKWPTESPVAGLMSATVH